MHAFEESGRVKRLTYLATHSILLTKIRHRDDHKDARQDSAIYMSWLRLGCYYCCRIHLLDLSQENSVSVPKIHFDFWKISVFRGSLEPESRGDSPSAVYETKQYISSVTSPFEVNVVYNRHGVSYAVCNPSHLLACQYQTLYLLPPSSPSLACPHRS